MARPARATAAAVRRPWRGVAAPQLHARGFFSWVNTPSVAETVPTPTHVPVLLDETVTLWLNPLDTAKKAKLRKRRQPQHVVQTLDGKVEMPTATAPRFFVDGTAGFGGHSRELLVREPQAQLLCIDRDPEVLAIARANLSEFKSRVVFHRGSYADLSPALLQSVHFPDEVHGICVDLGANSFHFDEPRRGFSFLRDGPLDMRYDQHDATAATAAHVVNTFSEVQLTHIFRDLGEERLAKEFAKAIVRDREEKGVVFTRTSHLRECIERIARKWHGSSKKPRGSGGSSHPATKCFQALRIYVNDELTHVAAGVEQLVAQLAPTGRLATIAFHSLEDRPIKLLFRRLVSLDFNFNWIGF
jgi:16S rRNA (cytosine1402-N4)-methyltransferase